MKLFQAARNKHGRIDHVFANAGIDTRAELLTLDLDEHGDPKQPDNVTLETNLQSVLNKTTLAVHYLKSQSEGGSIVLTGSSTGLHPIRAVDYGTCCMVYRCLSSRLTRGLPTPATAKVVCSGSVAASHVW